MQPGTSSSSSSSLPSEGKDKRRGSRGAPGVASREASSPPARPRSSERGGSVAGRSYAARERVLSPRLLRGLGRVRLLICSGRFLSALLPRLPLPAHHSMLCDVVGQKSLLWSAPVCDPPVFPDLRIEEQGRIAEPALGRTALVIAPVILSLLTACGQAVESVGGRSCLNHCPPANFRDVIVIDLGLQTALDRISFALGLG